MADTRPDIKIQMRQESWRLFDRDVAELTESEMFCISLVWEAEAIVLTEYVAALRDKAARWDRMIETGLVWAETWANADHGGGLR